MVERPIFHASMGEFLVRTRKALDWNQSDAVRYAKQRGLTRVTRNVLIRLEDGQTRHPDADVLRELAQLYGLPYTDLLNQYLESEYGVSLSGRDLSGHTDAASSAYAAATRQIEQLKRQLADLRELADTAQDVASRLLKVSVRDGETEAARSPQSQSARRPRSARD